MRSLDWQVLEMLYRVSRGDDGHIVDLTIYEEGERRLCPGWAGQVKHSYKLEYDYAPQVSLSLGRLEKQGLVKSKKHPTNNFRYWRLTPKGSKLAKGMVAHESV